MLFANMEALRDLGEGSAKKHSGANSRQSNGATVTNGRTGRNA
jgi:hypothetical protein